MRWVDASCGDGKGCNEHAGFTHMVSPILLLLLTLTLNGYGWRPPGPKPNVPIPSVKGRNESSSDGAARVNTRHTRRVHAKPVSPRSLP